MTFCAVRRHSLLPLLAADELVFFFLDNSVFFFLDAVVFFAYFTHVFLDVVFFFLEAVDFLRGFMTRPKPPPLDMCADDGNSGAISGIFVIPMRTQKNDRMGSGSISRPE